MTLFPVSLILGAGLMSLAWLMPNHYPPWTSFHSEVTAAFGFGLLAAAWLGRQRARAAWPRLALLAVAFACIPPLQALSGLVLFWGDAWIASLYLIALAMALVTGYGLAQHGAPVALLRAACLAVVYAAIASLGIALYQWLSLSGLGVLAVDLPPAGRPFANVAQPNHLATLLVLGMLACIALRQCGDLGKGSFGLALGFLCLGVVMTQSRAAWVEVSVLILGLWLLRERADFRISRGALVALAVGFVLLTLGWETLCEVLYLPVGRTLAEQAGDGARRLLWAATLRAVVQAPWFGYGWNQVSVAQSRLALENPPTGVMFEHSHSLFLDLLVWNGVPLGLLLTVALVWWFWNHLRACRDAATAFLLIGIAVVFAHALLEFPLDYAYILLPAGLAMGAVDARSKGGWSVSLARPLTLGLAGLAVALGIWVFAEYMQAEDNYRQLRFESARIGSPAVKPDVPNLVVLTQLRELLRFARTEASRDMQPQQLELMRKVAERYGYPSVMFRYALAAALNGRPDVAQDTLIRLCRVHEAKRCAEGRLAWQQLAEQRYPELRTVPFAP